MGLFDKFKGKTEEAVDQHGDKVDSGLDKAGSTIDERTGGQHSEHIDKGTDKAREGLDGLDGQQGDDLGAGQEGGGQEDGDQQQS